MRVGFIGLGIQGAPMARRIASAGFPTTLWARRPDSLREFADTGAEFADSPAELAAASDLVCLCVVADADVREVLTRPDGVLAGLEPGSIVAVHSTVQPGTCRELADELDRHGGALVDAPVTGGGPAAAAGRLTVLVGGAEPALRRCRPVFDTYAAQVFHLGPVGSGQVAKILNNLLFTANLATADNALTLGRQLGLDPVRLAELLDSGSAASFALTRMIAAGATLQSIATHAGDLLRKDVHLAADLAQQVDAGDGVVFDAAVTTLATLDRILGK